MSSGENIFQNLSTCAKNCLNRNNVLMQTLLPLFSNIRFMVNLWLSVQTTKWTKSELNTFCTMCVNVERAESIHHPLKSRCLKSDLFWCNTEMLTSRPCNWERSQVIHFTGKQRGYRGILYWGKLGVCPRNWMRSAKLMVIREVGMRARTRSVNLAEAEEQWACKQIEM